jgi:hypothetical protein
MFARTGRNQRTMNLAAHRGLVLGVPLLLLACSSATPPIEIDAMPPDAGVRADAPCGESCNPTANTGCSASSRCAVVLDAGRDCQIYCERLGDMPIGAACTRASDGVDNCMGKATCADGICRELCQQDPDSCNEGACELLGLAENQVVGVCR